VAHVSSTVPGVVRSDSPVGQETFWREGQLLVAEEVAENPRLSAELGGRDYESAGGVRRYRLPNLNVEEIVSRLGDVPELQRLVSVNHLFAAQHRPPWYDHSHETYHFANFEPPTPALAGPPPHVAPDPTEPPVAVGILDSTVENPWVRSRVEIVRILAPDPTPLPADAAGHADLVAGVVLAEAPNARVMTAEVMDPGGLVEEFQVIRALDRKELQECRALLLAFAGYTADDLPPPALSKVLGRRQQNQVVVAAAGNGGHSRRRWPAALPNVVSVGALDTAARVRWVYSDHGSWVDIWGPGVDIVSTYRDWDSAVWSGTSAAAAIVCGRVATLIAQGHSPQTAIARLAERGTEYRA
jgi:hypothetical protein